MSLDVPESDQSKPSSGLHLRVVEFSMLALVFTLVAARLYSRKRFLGRIFCDDIYILLATVLLSLPGIPAASLTQPRLSSPP
jgi:hypothetical protein